MTVRKYWGLLGMAWLMVWSVAKAQTAVDAAVPATADVVAQVNGQPVSRAAFEWALSERLRQGVPDSPALRAAVRRDLVIQTVLSEQAVAERLDTAPQTAVALAMARDSVLAQVWQRQWVEANLPSAAEVEAEYQALKARTGDKEYQIRQVVLRDETAAQLVLEQIQAGKTLAEMAKAYSIESLGKADGGLLPWVNAGALVPPLGEAIQQAKVGQRLPQPVRTPNGFHIVELVAERPFAFPPLEQLQDRLRQTLAQRKLAAAVQAQIDRAKIVLP